MGLDMDSDSLRQDLERLERKVDSLRWMSLAQMVALGAILLFSVLKTTRTLVYWGIAALVLILLLRPAFPGWMKWLGRNALSFIQSRGKAGDQAIS
jgi:hypothetical protein